MIAVAVATHVTLAQVAGALALIAVAIGASYWRKADLEQDIAVAVVRSFEGSSPRSSPRATLRDVPTWMTPCVRTAERAQTTPRMDDPEGVGVCIFIEAAFGFQGLGTMSVTAMFGTVGLDLPLILAVVVVITAIVVVGNLLVDLLYAFIDPRAGQALRERETKSLAGGMI